MPRMGALIPARASENKEMPQPLNYRISTDGNVNFTKLGRCNDRASIMISVWLR